MKIIQIATVSESDTQPRIIVLCDDGNLYSAWLNGDQTVDKWIPLSPVCERTIEKQTLGQILKD